MNLTKFKYAFDNKRYHTWNYYLRNTFGEKVFKVSINAGFTCPNIDGKVAFGGCTYCSKEGSGDFAGNPKDNLIKLIQDKFETISEQAAEEFANVFLDLQKKCENSEISSKALDIRGLLDSIALMEKGLEVHTALNMGITNKSFDMYEQTLIKDTIGARISKKIKTEDLFKK